MPLTTETSTGGYFGSLAKEFNIPELLVKDMLQDDDIVLRIQDGREFKILLP